MLKFDSWLLSKLVFSKHVVIHVWMFIRAERNAEGITAIATCFLCIGALYAVLQYSASVRSAKVVESGNLLREWNDEKLWEQRGFVDEHIDFRDNIKRANRAYRLVHSRMHRKAYKILDEVFNNFIEDHARLADRIEIYIRRNIADEGIIIEHLGYDILSQFIIIQDILARRAIEENLNYESFRMLAIRVQDYTKIHRAILDIDDDLIYEKIRDFNYPSGEKSSRYKRTNSRKFFLIIAYIGERIRLLREKFKKTWDDFLAEDALSDESS